MTDKEMVGVRLPPDTLERVQRYADDHDLSKSDALRRMIEKGVDLEEAGLAVAASQKTNQEEEEKEAIADGGFLRLSDHPWIDPIINVVDYSALFGMILMASTLLSVLLVFPLVEWMGVTGLAVWVGAFYALFVLGTMMVIVSVVGVLALEYLMHPSEAPIRRYFYDQEEEAEVITA
jgi:predicted DNA-binding protein